MIERPFKVDQGTPASGEAGSRRGQLPQSCSTPFERFLLSTVIIIFPLQNYFPAVAGMSSMFLIFAVFAAYIIVNRPRSLGETWYHPIFFAAYAFIGVSTLLEFSSPFSRYDDILRFGHMIGGAVCVAVLCRDRSALAAGLYSYIAGAVWVSVLLYLTSYGVLQGVQADDFNQATKARAQAFGDKPIGANLNALAFVCGQGAVVAFAMSLSGSSKHRRTLLLGVAAFCLVAAFLTMSRSIVVMSLITFAVILYAYGLRHAKTLIIVSILGLGIYTLVPDAVWSRMSYSTEIREGTKQEGRAWLYTTAVNRLPEYIVAGVGSGHFFGKWGAEKGFLRVSMGVVYGVHNSLLQITINWGVLGLLTFLWIIWWVYRSIPLQCGRDELSLALLGIIVSLGPFLLVSHAYYDKQFALGMGILVGARQWIWPGGIVPAIKAVDARKEAVR
jgi:hypothetical protein